MRNQPASHTATAAEFRMCGERRNQPPIRGGWRTFACAADGGISHRSAAAGGNHFCARDAPPVEKLSNRERERGREREREKQKQRERERERKRHQKKTCATKNVKANLTADAGKNCRKNAQRSVCHAELNKIV